MTQSSQVFRPTREHVLAIALMTGIALIGISWAPLILGWLLIFPAVYLVWVYTSSTTVDDAGIGLKYPVRAHTRIAWEDLAGIGFRGATALATTTSGAEHRMPGVTFNSLPELSEASHGRIRDVITDSAEFADGKYEIIDREGRKVLLDREEYDAYLREHPDTPGPRPHQNEPTTNEGVTP